MKRMKIRLELIAIIGLLIGAGILPSISGEITKTQYLTIEESVDYLFQPPTGPVASFNFTPEHPMENKIVTFDASESDYPPFDPDIEVEIIGYKWDLTNNGVYDDATGETIQHSWSQEGVYIVSLKVLGNLGINDTIDRGIQIYRPTELSIESISTENGRIHARIQNVGDGYCNIDWKITVSGGFLNFVDVESTGIGVLDSGDTETVMMDKDALGFGIVEIFVEVNAVNADKISMDAQGFLLGSFIFLL